MNIADLTPEMAQCAFEEFLDTWLSTWAADHQWQDTPRTSFTYFKGFVENDIDEEGKQ